MKSDSRRIESSTATAVTSARSTKVDASEGIRFHSAWAAKKVAKRIAIAAASSALAVTDSGGPLSARRRPAARSRR